MREIIYWGASQRYILKDITANLFLVSKYERVADLITADLARLDSNSQIIPQSGNAANLISKSKITAITNTAPIVNVQV